MTQEAILSVQDYIEEYHKESYHQWLEKENLEDSEVSRSLYLNLLGDTENMLDSLVTYAFKYYPEGYTEFLRDRSITSSEASAKEFLESVGEIVSSL